MLPTRAEAEMTLIRVLRPSRIKRAGHQISVVEGTNNALGGRCRGVEVSPTPKLKRVRVSTVHKPDKVVARRCSLDRGIAVSFGTAADIPIRILVLRRKRKEGRERKEEEKKR